MLVLLRRCGWIESKRARCKKDEDRPCHVIPLAHGIRPARADGLLVFVVAMRRGSRPPRKARHVEVLHARQVVFASASGDLALVLSSSLSLGRAAMTNDAGVAGVGSNLIIVANYDDGDA